MSASYRWQGNNLLLSVRVQPRASRDELCGWQEGVLKIRITAPPVEGKANAHLLRFIGQCFAVAQSQVELLAGSNARTKRLCIHQPKLLPVELGISRDN